MNHSKFQNSASAGKTFFPTLLGILLIIASADTAHAHVKWFNEDFSFLAKPNGFEEILNSTFYWLAILSMVVIALMVILEQWIDHLPWMKNLDKWLSGKSNRNLDVMRLGMGATLLWAWQAGTLLTPELKIESEWIFWLEFLAAFLLIFPKTIPASGACIIFLYVISIWKFGFFYMLDYCLCLICLVTD